ncbi:MAG: hypothetical protein KQJ78_02155 [Deltaproteobacteria bacterium]|nr:hypothetical protein [Deltaproteobacteria bacterium]
MAIYTGGGSSHSWLWFAELCEKAGWPELRFLDQLDIRRGGLTGQEVLAVSGGDTFGMAAALGPRGAAALRRFISDGGLYLGACAGAYLPLRSSKEPLNLFNFVEARINNLTNLLPPAQLLPEKFCSTYGCAYVYHPVREAVALRAADRGAFAGEEVFEAPLYGGPALVPGSPEQVLARYEAFTPRTLFLVEQGLATETLLGHAAVLRAPLGRGWMYLFGPHFEHPHYARANQILCQVIEDHLPAIRQNPDPTAASAAPEACRSWLRDLKREVSNVRIVALGLEDHPVRWLLGKKVYEPAKLRVFAEAVWPRLVRLEREGRAVLPPDGGRGLVELWRSVTRRVRSLRQLLDQEEDTLDLARGLFPDLNQAASRFMTTYFATLAAGRPHEARPREKEAAA